MIESPKPSFGFARMHVEAGERRDFLPETIARLHKSGANVFLEHGYGSGLGYQPEDYLHGSPSVQFTTHEEVYQKDFVVVLRCPNDQELNSLKPGSCLISMLHYPTRPRRTELIRSLGVEAISLDSIKDDVGRRLIGISIRSPGTEWEVAFRVLRTIYPAPGFESPHRQPIHTILLGSGAVAVHVVQAGIRYGDLNYGKEMIEQNVPGVQLTVVDYDSNCEEIKCFLCLKTQIFTVDATQRPNPSRPVILMIGWRFLPQHAVLVDLSVDPYQCNPDAPISIKGIEGIPQGNLDQYVFAPDDPAYELIPSCIETHNRRYAVSCYSFRNSSQKCMQVYGQQMRPIFNTLVERGGVAQIRSKGKYFERAIFRAMLSNRQEN